MTAPDPEYEQTYEPTSPESVEGDATVAKPLPEAVRKQFHEPNIVKEDEDEEPDAS